MNLLFFWLSEINKVSQQNSQNSNSNKNCYIDLDPSDHRFQHIFEVLNPYQSAVDSSTQQSSNANKIKVALINGNKGSANIEWICWSETQSHVNESQTDTNIKEKPQFPLYCHIKPIESDSAQKGNNNTEQIPYCISNSLTLTCRRAGGSYGRKEGNFSMYDLVYSQFDVDNSSQRVNILSLQKLNPELFVVKKQNKNMRQQSKPQQNESSPSLTVDNDDQTAKRQRVTLNNEQQQKNKVNCIKSTTQGDRMKSNHRQIIRVIRKIRLHLDFEPCVIYGNHQKESPNNHNHTSTSMNYFQYKGTYLPRIQKQAQPVEVNGSTESTPDTQESNSSQINTQSETFQNIFIDSPALSNHNIPRSSNIDNDINKNTDIPIDLILATPRPKVLEKLLTTLSTLNIRKIYLLSQGCDKVEPSFAESCKKVFEQGNIQKNLIEGMEQSCFQTRLPIVKVLPKLGLGEVVDGLSVMEEQLESPQENISQKKECHDSLHNDSYSTTLKLVGHPYQSKKLRQILKERTQSQRQTQRTNDKDSAQLPKITKVLLAIGPEGGWSDREIDGPLKDFEKVSLGPRILKTYDAAVALLSIVREELCD